MEIRFVYEVKKWIEEDFEGHKHEVAEPTGEGHIFTMELIKGKMEISGTSLCGKSRIQIGKKTTVKQSRVPSLQVCRDCSESWKKHPDSEWNKFVAAVK